MKSQKTPNKKVPKNNSPIGQSKIYWIYGIIALIFLGIQFSSINTSQSITETEFLNKVENNEVKSVTFVTNAGYAEVELNNSSNSSKLQFRYSDIKDVKEQIRLKNSDNYFGKRFAAKEATWKALNPLRGDGLFFKEIEVLNDLNGKPFLLFTGKTKIYIQKKEKTLNSKLKFDISISDEPPFIIAFVVISLAPNA